MVQQVHVDKSDLSQAQVVDVDPGPLADGALRLGIDKFSVTANNVTYAIAGDAVGYWNFFPPQGDSTDGKGIVPMWGTATVIQSNHPDFVAGERLTGFLPMATQLDVLPGKIKPSHFVDMAEHRQPMSVFYNQYQRLANDPEHDPAREDERMLFNRLFKTGFLIESFMRRAEWYGATQAVLTSASSKTALSLASVAKRQSPGIKLVGVTSASNVAFVEKIGLYDRVVSYDEVASIGMAPSVSVDFAGNPDVLRAVHERLGEQLKFSSLVGITHSEIGGMSQGLPADFPGPKPVFFFAPDEMMTLFKTVGPEEAGRQMVASWQDYLKLIDGTVEIKHYKGIAAGMEAFVAMAAGSVDPSRGIIIDI
ncbi:DUF2855 family protein [Qipengyuania marisflavi]|uniref:DUF2855 family protein n=1 Tax=Qipengyuania marisflavi TaxID=2486356 RepID=A0A5S3Q168_9SPHN|nr:DUF2855 family protein [Qipengyuania marisflavi]TMM50097.1 DUF2855 family protein [Qipengyuania marisflavi]